MCPGGCFESDFVGVGTSKVSTRFLRQEGVVVIMDVGRIVALPFELTSFEVNETTSREPKGDRPVVS